MSNDEIEIIGKNVKDMYGTFMGKVVGTITDIDSTIQTVGIDCGSEGLRQIPFDQLVVQNEVVIFIPKWRLDSQRLLREKGLTLRRIKALIDIVSSNDDMKDDAELIHEKYKSKLSTLDAAEREIKARLDARTAELEDQIKAVKLLIFDAEIQFKSNEISESKFESVKTHTTDIIERITHEQSEIENVKRRVADLSLEVEQATQFPTPPIHDAAITYLGKEGESEVQSKLPEAPTEAPVETPSDVPATPVMPIIDATTPESTPVESNHTAIVTESSVTLQETSTETPPEERTEESDWLARMEAQ